MFRKPLLRCVFLGACGGTGWPCSMEAVSCRGSQYVQCSVTVFGNPLELARSKRVFDRLSLLLSPGLTCALHTERRGSVESFSNDCMQKCSCAGRPILGI